jgi:hypothetical protein
MEATENDSPKASYSGPVKPGELQSAQVKNNPKKFVY